jgi:hypothetical protein
MPSAQAAQIDEAGSVPERYGSHTASTDRQIWAAATDAGIRVLIIVAGVTLVLSYVSNDFVVQVSDRRLSRGGEPLPTEFNKAVVWCGLAVIGYTGFAFVDRRQRQPDDQVDEWITEQLYRRDSVASVLEVLASASPAWVNRMPETWRAQAYSVVGWAPQRDGGVVPFIALVSNFHDDQGRVRNATSADFTRLLASPPPLPWFVGQIGEPLSPAEIRAMKKALDRLIGEAAPDRVANVLVQIVRMVAARVPKRVGRAVMVSCLPRPGSAAPNFFLTERRGRPTMDTPTFFYRGEDRDDRQAYGPLWVCGEQGFSDASLEYLNETGSDVSFEVRLRGPKT